MTIPASEIVSVTPSVLPAGGSAIDLNGLILTLNSRIPIGAVQSFAAVESVNDFFGATSDESALARVYFAGFDGSNVKPGELLMAQYPKVAVGAYLRGGNISALTLGALQAITGTLTITLDGYARPIASLNLSSATSFSSAAGLIQTALNAVIPAGASFTGVIAGTTLTASALTGVIGLGQKLGGAGITAGTFIVAQLTGMPGAAGNYQVSASQTIGSEAMTSAGAPAVVTYDSVAGAFWIASSTWGAVSTAAFATGTAAAPLLLTAATGATLSQGADAATPSGFMDALALVSQNWGTFLTLFDPDGGSGNTAKLAFALWTSQQNDRYAYACWDHDVTPTLSNLATGSLGYIVRSLGYSGVVPIYAPDGILAAFNAGIGASLDFAQTDGRATYKFRSQGGLLPSVTDLQVARNLDANGYNFYGAYATASNQFTNYDNGSISGDFEWQDSYMNQIWLNNGFQLALVTLLQSALSIPYNAAGYGRIGAAMQGMIDAGENFGAFRKGVDLSPAQIADVNAQAGFNIATTLQNVGYYLLVKPPSAAVRQARGSPPITFFYVDGQSVQQIDLSSIDVQ